MNILDKLSEEFEMKRTIKWMLILGLVYIFFLWYASQSSYRCDRLEYLPYLKLMCEM